MLFFAAEIVPVTIVPRPGHPEHGIAGAGRVPPRGQGGHVVWSRMAKTRHDDSSFIIMIIGYYIRPGVTRRNLKGKHWQTGLGIRVSDDDLHDSDGDSDDVPPLAQL